MDAAPPVLPDKALRRVLLLARGDGWSVVIIASLGGLVSLVQGGWAGAGTALLVALAGAGELRGLHLLRRRKLAGVNWLIGAQLFLLAIICTYAWYRWRFFDAAMLWAELPAFVRSEVDRQLLTAGLDPELDRPLLLQTTNLLVCAILALVTLAYQGGLALFYAFQRERIREAFLTPPPIA